MDESEDSTKTAIEDLSPEEARRYLIRFLGQQDLEEHDEIYEDLANE